MKRWFRPVAYSLILVLVALAVFADPSPEPADAFVRAAPPHAEPAATASGGDPVEATPPAATRARSKDRFAQDLFAAPAPPPPPAPVDTATPVAAPVPELKVLGFLESDGVPQVFVELGGETAALTPGQLAGDVFRFDSIGAGMARFTYLPTGATSEFAVSDPDVAAE